VSGGVVEKNTKKATTREGGEDGVWLGGGGGGFQQIQLTTEDRQNGDLWAVAP